MSDLAGTCALIKDSSEAQAQVAQVCFSVFLGNLLQAFTALAMIYLCMYICIHTHMNLPCFIIL